MGEYRTIVADPPWPIGSFPGFGKPTPCPYPTMSIQEIEALPVGDLADNEGQDTHLYLWAIDQFLPEAFGVARAWGFTHSCTIVWCKKQIGKGLGGIWPANVEFVLFCRKPRARPDILKLTTSLAVAARERGITIAEINRRMGLDQMARWWLTDREELCACPSMEHWPKLKALLGLGHELDELVATLNAEKGPGQLQRAPSRWFEWPRGAHSAKPEAFLDIVEQVSPGPYLEMFARRARFGWDYWGDESLGTATMEAA